MNFDLDINDLDINNIASWPIAARALLIVFVAIVIFGLGYWFDIKKQRENLQRLSTEQQTLRQTFETKQNITVNLPAYKQQMEQMKKLYNGLLKQLPESKEVPGLVEDISHQGLASGLVFKSIKLRPEQKVDFYAELAMDITVEGTYHQLAEFVSNVASLPRIVTLHDLQIVSKSKDLKQEILSMDVTAKTYRYVGDVK